jgi:hypothetical protein
MKKVKLWVHAMYEMVEHNEFSQKLNEPAFVRAENYNYVFKRCENLDAENARLKAEVERLTAIVGADAIDRKHGMCCDASAQVERLTKAGDNIIEAMNECCSRRYTEEDEAIERWYAAKEGKQPNG